MLNDGGKDSNLILPVLKKHNFKVINITKIAKSFLNHRLIMNKCYYVNLLG